MPSWPNWLEVLALEARGSRFESEGGHQVQPEEWQSLAECTALEMRHTCKGIVGSNPTSSAINK